MQGRRYGHDIETTEHDFLSESRRVILRGLSADASEFLSPSYHEFTNSIALGVVLIDPSTGDPYVASGGGGGGSSIVVVTAINPDAYLSITTISGGSLSVTLGSVTIQEPLTVDGLVSIDGTVDVSGTVTIPHQVNVSGTVTVPHEVSVSGTVTVPHEVSVSGTVTIPHQVGVSGTVTTNVALITKVAASVTSRVDFVTSSILQLTDLGSAEKGVAISASASNSESVFVGGPSVNYSLGNANCGYPLEPGDKLVLEVRSAEDVYVVAPTATQILGYIQV